MFQQSSTLDTDQTHTDSNESRVGPHTPVGVCTGFQHVKLGFVSLSEFSSRLNLKSNSRLTRLKWVEITSVGRSEFQFTQAIVTYPSSPETDFNLRLQWNKHETFTTNFELSPKVQKNTSGTYSSLKGLIRLTIGQGILQTHRYMEMGTDWGSEACTLFHSGTDVRNTCLLWSQIALLL